MALSFIFGYGGCHHHHAPIIDFSVHPQHFLSFFHCLVNCSCFSDCPLQRENTHFPWKQKVLRKSHLPLLHVQDLLPFGNNYVMFGDGIASCTLKEHISSVYIYILDTSGPPKLPCWKSTMHVHNNTSSTFTTITLSYRAKHYWTPWVSYHFSVFGGHRRPWYLDLFERGLLVAILSPKNVRFQLRDPDLV